MTAPDSIMLYKALGAVGIPTLLSTVASAQSCGASVPDDNRGVRIDHPMRSGCPPPDGYLYTVLDRRS